MVARAHLAIGNHALNTILMSRDIKIYKNVFLFGCIAPDINFIYPCHNILATPKRFKARIRRMINIKSPLVRSFTLGVIMHYICDYFCIAHNNNNYGAKHTMYERIMCSYIKRHILIVDNEPLNLNDCWNEAVNNYKLSEEKTNKEIEDCWAKCTEVFSIIKEMNNQYRTFIEQLVDTDWYHNKEQMQFDINWAVYLTDRVYEMIYSPIEYIA